MGVRHKNMKTLSILFALLVFGSVYASDYEVVGADALAKIPPGGLLAVKRNGHPAVLILRSSNAELLSLEEENPALADPSTEKVSKKFERLFPIEVQASYISTAHRSINPEFFVFVPIGPNGPGCILNVYPPGLVPEEDNLRNIIARLDWKGGFVDSCDGTAYDLSGRLFGSGDGLNLEIPVHRYDEAGNLTIGGRGA